jgi:hypothetical protein
MLTVERLKQLLYYDPETGIFTWRARRRGVMRHSIAGGADPRGYVRIRIDRHLYHAHRLAWFWVHERWPVGKIDHANLNKSDNRIANLREATNTENARNCEPLRLNNTSGYKGVSLRRSTGKWVTYIDRKHLGFFDTPEEAAAAYEAACRKYHGAFARPAPVGARL